MTKTIFSQKEIISNFEKNYYDEYDFMQIQDIKVRLLVINKKRDKNLMTKILTNF